MHVHTVPIAIPLWRLGWAQTHKACQLHSNAYISSLKAMHAFTQFHASLASIITIVSPCWVNLEAATCTAFTYNTHDTMWGPVSRTLAICMNVLEQVIIVLEQASKLSHELSTGSPLLRCMHAYAITLESIGKLDNEAII